MHHPMVLALVDYKWNQFAKQFYYGNLTQLAVYVFLLTAYIIVTKPVHFWNVECSNATNLKEYTRCSNTDFWYWMFPIFNTVGQWIIILLALINLLKEVKRIKLRF